MVTLSVLPACTHLGDLQQGKLIHDYINRNGLDYDVCIETTIIEMYGKCGNIDLNSQLSGKTSKTYMVTWNEMIFSYAQSGHANEVLTLFNQMKMIDMKPIAVTMT